MCSRQIDTRSQYQNRITDEEPNSGSRGKLNAEQLEERIELHAKRKIFQSPTFEEIALHWRKYDITMHPQTEKTWSYTPANQAKIERRVDELFASGEVQSASINDAALVNTLALGAKEQALTLKDNGSIIRRYLKDFDKDNLVNGTAVPKSLSEKKAISALLRDLSQVSKIHGENLTDMVKLATTVNRSGNLKDEEIRRHAKMIADADKLKKAQEQDKKALDGALDITELSEARKTLEKEHGDK